MLYTRYIIVYFRYLNSQASLCIKYCLPWLFSAKYLSAVALLKKSCPNEMPYPYRTTINKFSLVQLNATHSLPRVVQLLSHRKLLYLSRKSYVVSEFVLSIFCLCVFYNTLAALMTASTPNSADKEGFPSLLFWQRASSVRYVCVCGCIRIILKWSMLSLGYQRKASRYRHPRLA